MGFAMMLCRAQQGMEAPEVRVEVNTGNGLPSFQIIGMPETTVREAKDRVRTAIQNSGIKFPVAKITVNLSPAELPKQGARFDLAIALGILAAEEARTPPQTPIECYGGVGARWLYSGCCWFVACIGALSASKSACFGVGAEYSGCLVVTG